MVKSKEKKPSTDKHSPGILVMKPIQNRLYMESLRIKLNKTKIFI